jgi:hypothetical protein
MGFVRRIRSLVRKVEDWRFDSARSVETSGFVALDRCDIVGSYKVGFEYFPVRAVSARRAIEDLPVPDYADYTFVDLGSGKGRMLFVASETRHHQPSLWTGVLVEEVDDLWEPWMRNADNLLEDERLIEQVFEAQGKRWKKSRTRGRKQTPAEVVLSRPQALSNNLSGSWSLPNPQHNFINNGTPWKRDRATPIADIPCGSR